MSSRAPSELEEAYQQGNTIPGILAEIENDAIRRVVLERLEIYVAFEYSTGVADRARRALELSELFLSHAPSEPVLRYLRRLTRCYVAGFRAECIILARGVLENALRERYARARKPMPAAQRERIDTAHRLGWLSSEGRRAAQDVWTRGNKVVHDDPEITRDILGTIGMAAVVLRELAVE